MPWKLKRLRQCAKCPWKVSTNPREIPRGYSEARHRALTSAIAAPGQIDDQAHVMACLNIFPHLKEGDFGSQSGDRRRSSGFHSSRSNGPASASLLSHIDAVFRRSIQTSFEDVERSVQIGILDRSAGGAFKNRLALAASVISGSAGRTVLGGKMWLTLLEPAVALHELVFELARDLEPTDV